MAFKSEITEAEYTAMTPEKQAEYKKMSGEYYREGMYYLDVIPSGGFALEPVDGLKSALQKERSRAETAERGLKTFDGIDPEKARKAEDRIKTLQAATSGEKFEAEVQARMTSINEKHRLDLEGSDQEKAVLMGQLQEEIVNARAVAALNKLKGNADLLLPHILARTKVVKVDLGDGKSRFEPRVIDPSNPGQDLITKTPGSTAPMALEELVSTMKENEVFAAGFEDVNASGFGSGNEGKGGGGGAKKVGDRIIIKRGDQEAMNAHVDEIAAGEVDFID